MGGKISSSQFADELPCKRANRLDSEAFRKAYFEPAIGRFNVPKNYVVEYRDLNTISDDDLNACFELVHSTSEDAYRASSWGWSNRRKMHEMREEYMKYLILRRSRDSNKDRTVAEDMPGVLGFLSFMLTIEEGIDVVYCYEVHLNATVRGQGLGVMLMRLMEHIGSNVGVSSAMLTVFTSNEAARKFYEHHGYYLYDEEAPPPPKRLRSRDTGDQKPTYVILAKDLAKGEAGSRSSIDSKSARVM